MQHDDLIKFADSLDKMRNLIIVNHNDNNLIAGLVLTKLIDDALNFKMLYKQSRNGDSFTRLTVDNIGASLYALQCYFKHWAPSWTRLIDSPNNTTMELQLNTFAGIEPIEIIKMAIGDTQWALVLDIIESVTK